MSFYKQGYDTRMKLAGDIAEGKFTEYAKKHNLVCAKYGFDRGIDKFWKVPQFVTNTPDFLVIGDKAVLVEAKGTGRGDSFKIKETDMVSLSEWNKIMPVFFFVYDSSLDKHTLIEYNTLYKETQTAKTGVYPDNNKLYYMIPKEQFKWTK